MNIVAKVFFEADSVENMFLVGEEFFYTAMDNGWTIGGAIKEEFIKQAEELARQIAIKNGTVASVTIYGTREDGRFNPGDKKEIYELH